MNRPLTIRRKEEKSEPSRSNAFNGREGQVEGILEYGGSKSTSYTLNSEQRTVKIGEYIFHKSDLPNASDLNPTNPVDREIAQILDQFNKKRRQ